MYGKSVEGENFTDRKVETQRLKMNFENGINTILISPRRIGKTSLVKKVQSLVDTPNIKVVFMDVYDCRSEYEFLNRFASAIIKETAGHVDRVMSTLREFLSRVVPKISYSPDAISGFSLSLGITPQNYQPEEILQLPEAIAQKKGIHIVVCIDEFQQIGELSDSVSVQKRMRGVWQHQQNVSYCIFGSKQHMMEKIFQSRRMPFYQFGEITNLQKIPRDDWMSYIIERFNKQGKNISAYYAGKICDTVECYSSYVQQLAWDVMLQTETEVTEESFNEGVEALLEQNSGLFMNQIDSLSSYQINFIRALCDGHNANLTSKSLSEEYHLGSKSNITRIKAALVAKELIEVKGSNAFIVDPVFKFWFKKSFDL